MEVEGDLSLFSRICVLLGTRNVEPWYLCIWNTLVALPRGALLVVILMFFPIFFLSFYLYHDQAVRNMLEKQERRYWRVCSLVHVMHVANTFKKVFW